MSEFKKQSLIKILFIIPLLLLIFHCSGDKSTTPGLKNEVVQNVAEITEFQDEGDLQLGNLLTEMDTTAALDSLLQLILADTAVKSAEATDQGLMIEYKNGIIGGILVNLQDEPDSTVFNIEKAVEKKLFFQSVVDTPLSTKTVFIDPHYEERVNYANQILELYNTSLLGAEFVS